MKNVSELVGKVVKVKVVGEAFTGRKTKERKLQADVNGLYIEYKGFEYPVEYVEAEDRFQVTAGIDPVKSPEKAPKEKKASKKAEPEVTEQPIAQEEVQEVQEVQEEEEVQEPEQLELTA